MSFPRLNTGFAGAEEGVTLRYPGRLASVLAATEGDRPLEIIDLGSAVGTISLWLASLDQRFRVTGIDSDPELVAQATARARERGSSAHFVAADASVRLPVADASVDAVVVHRLRDSIVDQRQRQTLTHELCRALRPAGWLSLVEDMRVEPDEAHGTWYARRYRVHRRALELLVAYPGSAFRPYSAWLNDPDTELLMSLRATDGTKLDDVAYDGNERALAEAITDGDVTLRGIGIHQGVRRVRADLEAVGLFVRHEWRVESPEPPPREGHAAVMKGLLCQRDDRPER